MRSATHEDFDREPAQESSSDRSFGLVFTVFFLLVGCWPLVHGKPLRVWAFFPAAGFLAAAVGAPRVLHPLNVQWSRLGRLLGKITNPIITGLLFYLIFTPAGLLLRMLGQDPLRLKYDRAAASYWISKDGKTATQDMRNQF